LKQGDEPMKLRRLASVCVVVVIFTLLVTLAPLPALAKDNKTMFTGTECWSEQQPPDDSISRTIGGGKKGYVSLTFWNIDATTDSRLNGLEVVTFHLIYETASGSGTYWGTLDIMDSPDGQVMWSGQLTGKLENWTVYKTQATLNGKGANKGLVAKLEESGDSSLPGCFVITGYIVETGAGIH
jgi:hypothetical protein